MKLATCQLQDVQGDLRRSLAVIKNHTAAADAAGCDVVCFPECFLQGYTLDPAETKKRSIDISSPQFQSICNQLTNYKPTIILGLIERQAGRYFNTAVVVRHGELLGRYRKVHLFEKNFQPGHDYPTFSVGGATFGLNICYDARFPDGAEALAQQGAQVIFYLLNNRLPVKKADAYRTKHLSNLIARAQEAKCWVISSDVVASTKHHVAYGHTAVIDPDGKIVAKAAELTEAMLIVDLGKAKQLRVQ